MEELNKKIIFIGGKDRVGKTTSAAALALNLANDGYQTLLISTGSLHNLEDIFNEKIGEEAIRITSHLRLVEVDPEIETKKYIHSLKEKIKGTIEPGMMMEIEVESATISLITDEVLLFDKLISIILEERDNCEKIIIDTLLTEYICLLSKSEVMCNWIDGERVRKARNILMNRNETGFIFVLTPEQLPIVETKKAIELLDKYHLNMELLIINKVIPEDADGDFIWKRRAREKIYIAQIEQNFAIQQLTFVPLFTNDVTCRQELEEFSLFLRRDGM